MRRAVLLVVAFALLPLAASAQKEPPRPTPPPREPAPQGAPHTKVHIAGEVVIGERSPDFELDASNGQPLRLASLRGDWVLLVFDSRKESVAGLRAVNDDLRAVGVRLAAVLDEKAYHLESYVKREPFPFPLLADPTLEISAIYGLHDHERSTTAPGYVLLDREGVVRMALLGQRFPPEDVARLVRFAITGL